MPTPKPPKNERSPAAAAGPRDLQGSPLREDGAGRRDDIVLMSAIETDELQELSADFLEAGRWWAHWRWLLLTAIGVTAFSLELAGARGSAWHRFEDALHLFPSGFPGRPPRGTSNLTQAAELLAPLVGLFLSVKLVSLVFQQQLTRLRARLRRGHVVVVGLDEKGFRAANGFLDSGRKVTCVAQGLAPDIAAHLRARGAIVLDEDGTQLSSLRAAAVQQASHVVCSASLDRDNAQAAAMVAQIAGQAARRAPIFVFVHIGDPELAHLMRAATLRLGPIRVHFFDINAIWARALLRAGPLDGARGPGRSPELVVVGATELGRALVIRAARRWHYGDASLDGGRLRIVVVDPQAEEACARIAARYPALSRRSDLVPVARSVDASWPGDFAGLFGTSASDAALYLCLADEAENLGLAMQARRQLGGRRVAILLPATAWTFRLQRLLLDPSSGIRPVFYSPHPNSLDLLEDSALESIARSVHATYLRTREPAADFGSRPADVSWGELAAGYREATRRNVDELVLELESLWYVVEPLYDWDEEPVELPEEQIEVLARLEHERWCRERIGAGWRYGVARDDAARLQPLLVSWEELDSQSKEIDRELVRARPRILAHAGYRLVRSPERELLAQMLHARHVDTRAAAEGPSGSGSSLVPWDELGPDERELSLSAVDDVALKLLRIGYRMTAGGGGALVLEPGEVETLAQAEHERWCRVRERQGWRYGATRDDARKLHPDLVPWGELDEARRQIDRDHVAELPSLVRESRHTVVRLVDLSAGGRPLTEASARSRPGRQVAREVVDVG